MMGIGVSVGFVPVAPMMALMLDPRLSTVIIRLRKLGG